MSVALLDVTTNLSVFSLCFLTASFFVAILPVIIFWQDITKRSSKFLFLLGLANFALGITNVYVVSSYAVYDLYYGVEILYATMATSSLFVFLFLYIFSDEDGQFLNKKLLAFILPYFAILSISIMYPVFFTSYGDTSGNILNSAVFSNGFVVYCFYIFSLVLAGVAFIVKGLRNSSVRHRVALRQLLIITCIAGLVATLFLIVSVKFALLVGFDLFWIANFSIILFIALSSYVLIKYYSLNIRIIVVELLILTVVIVLIAEIFFAGSAVDLLIKTVITIMIVFSSSFMVGCVKREIRSKETILRMSQDMELISRRLEILDRKKSDFLSVASHHLRDPLTAIRGYSSLLLDGSYGELQQSVKEALNKIFISSGNLITMISDFMDISRIESGDMNYNFTDVDMMSLVVDIVSEFKQSADRANLTISVTTEDDSPNGERYVTIGDEGKLRQVISNLIDNSIKYTPRGEISVLLRKDRQTKKILFSLSDTGIGMSEQTKEKIFRKFSRAEGVSKVYTEGTGLGLYVAKEIIKKHNGRIWAESKGEGGGSTFYIELEVKP